MKIKKHSFLFRGLVLVIVLALSIIYFPVDALVTLAYTALDSSIANYSYITVDDDENGYTVNKGATYQIPKAYIGGNTGYVIGDSSLSSANVSLSGSATFESSNITVTYGSLVVLDTDDDEVEADANGYYSFEASRVGTYTITYSFTYELNNETYTNSYSISVESSLASVKLDFEDNTEYFLPSILDLSLYGEDGVYDNLYIPLPTVTDSDEDEIEVTFVTSTSDMTDDDENYVLITANGGANGATVAIGSDENGFYIDGDYFADNIEGEETYGAGNYEVKYSFYKGKNFVKSVTKSTVVYSAETPYYTDYSLELQLSSTWTDNGQTGISSSLPSAVGVTSSKSDPASESVDVYYTVEVLYSGSTGWVELDADLYNEDEEVLIDVCDEEDNHVRYILADPTSFKPLEDGTYTFIYTIYDIYGNTVSTSSGSYNFENIEDETAPTPVIYDASDFEVDENGDYVKDEDGNYVPTYADASNKLASYTVANSVVIYAIGIDDNVSELGDEGVDLKRVIMTDETVTKLTIEGYDAYNLIFNYTSYSEVTAYNYYIRKAISNEGASVSNDVDMINWLKQHNYLIVIDNANADTIYEIFSSVETGSEGDTTNLFAGLTIGDSAVSDGDTLLEWLSAQDEDTIASYGFAYIDDDRTESFGATSGNNGMGTGTYYIHYIVTDAAGNETDTARSMTIVSTNSIDSEYADITFSTTLQTVYTPNATVTFNAPTASDDHDAYMTVYTWYRYLDENGTPIEVEDKDGNVISVNDLTSVWEDLEDTAAVANGKYLTETYSKYHTSGNNNGFTNDGYIDLTDSSASTYTIDLSEAGSTAVTLQIVVFVYDDAGNVNIYGQTIEISNSQDTTDPRLGTIEGAETTVYEQGETITLPTVTVYDDAIKYMGFEIKMVYTYTDTDGNQTSISVDPSGYYQYRNELTGTYTIYGGSVVASYAGNYQLTIAAYDSRGARVVVFVNYYVNSRTIIQSPTISSTLADTQTIEVDDYSKGDTLELPIPTLSYEISDSVTYDEYTSSNYEGDETFVIYGVNSDGKVTNYSTTVGSYGSFNVWELWENRGNLSELKYQLVYTVEIYVYNQNYFKLVESGDYTQENFVPGGYFTYAYEDSGSKTAIIYALDDGTLKVTADSATYILSESEDENGNTQIVITDEDGTTVKADNVTLFSYITSNVGSLRTWFNGLKKYVLTSKTYTIILQDTTGPTISDYDYDTSISVAELKAEYNSQLTIYGIDATDASGLDESKSQIVLSYQLANGTSSSKTWSGANAFSDQTFEFTENNEDLQNGTYTITYTVYDKVGNYSTKTYTIGVGDSTSPTLTFDADFIESSYEIGSSALEPLHIDLSLVTVYDNGKELQDGETTIALSEYSTSKYTVTLTNSSGDEIEADDSSTETDLYYYIDTVDTYTLTITVEDAVGWSTTETKTFEVTSATQETSKVYQIIGTILIVISVVVLIAVIVYFIVSKVKLDKELKK